MRAHLVSIVVVVAAAGCKDDNPQPDIPDSRRIDAPAPDVAIDAPVNCFLAGGTPANCFQEDVCEPTQLTDFLNGCTDGQCLPFDNAARLPLYNNGALPPIP